MGKRKVLSGPLKTEISELPDSPQSFGYKSCWLAMKTERTEEIIEAFRDLKFAYVGPANWATGMKAAYDHEGNYSFDTLFISPPVDGWTFVVGFGLDNFWCSHALTENEQATKKFLEFVKTLGGKVPDFFYFCSDRVSGIYCWAVIEKGSVRRAFASVNHGEIVYEQGPLTSEEIELGCVYHVDVENEDDYHAPDEDDVVNLAARWSFDPMILEDTFKENVGIGILLKSAK